MREETKYIAFYCPGLYPCITGGVEVFYHYLIKHLSSRQKLIVFSECQEVISPNVEMINLNSRRFLIRRFYLRELSHMITILVWLSRNKGKIKLFQIPHTSSAGYFGVLFPLIKWIYKVDYIIDLHGGAMKQWGWFSLQPLLFRRASVVCAVSKSMQIEFQRRIGRPIIVIPSLTPFTKCNILKEELKRKYNFNPSDKIIIVVGSIKPIKNNQFIFREFGALTKEFILDNNLHLVFVGDGQGLSKLREIVSTSSIKERVRLIGRVCNFKLNEIYGFADFYLIASEFESLSQTLLEAMFNGLPIIASNIEGLRVNLVHEQNAILFNLNENGSLADAIKRMIENSEFASRLGTQAKIDYNNRYNFNEVLAIYLSLYKTV